MIGERIRQTRLTRGLTQEQLAERSSLGTRQIWRYENGQTTPDGDIVAKIAVALQVSSDFLLGLTDEMKFSILESDLSPKEHAIIEAVRRGENYEAIKVIVGNE